MTYRKARDAAANPVWPEIDNGNEPTEKQQACNQGQLDKYYKECLKKNDGSIAETASLNADREAGAGVGRTVAGEPTMATKRQRRAQYFTGVAIIEPGR